MDDQFTHLRHLLMEDRSVRRFDASRPVSREVLLSLVDLTRYCSSGRNAQPLRYRIVDSPEERARLFPLLKWAGYYADWDGPSAEEQPVAYLVQCVDTEIAPSLLCDDGLHLQAITLGATALGLRGCIIKAFNAATTSRELGLDSRYRPNYVLALGYPAERVKIVDLKPDGDFKYYRDEADTQCVPKRSLEELLLEPIPQVGHDARIAPSSV